MGRLFPGQARQSDENDRGGSAQYNFLWSPRLGRGAPARQARFRQIPNQPDERDVQSDLWKISVTVGVALQANLHDSNDRNQHNDVPKPSDEQIRILFSSDDHNRCQRNQTDRSNQQPPNFQPVLRMDIKWNEIDRPKHLPDIFKITEDGVGDPPFERQELSRTERKVLGPQSGDARTDR